MRIKGSNLALAALATLFILAPVTKAGSDYCYALAYSGNNNSYDGLSISAPSGAYVEWEVQASESGSAYASGGGGGISIDASAGNGGSKWGSGVTSYSGSFSAYVSVFAGSYDYGSSWAVVSIVW